MTTCLVFTSVTLMISMVYINEIEGRFQFACPDGRVLSKINSYYIGVFHERRRWTHFCKILGTHQDCQWGSSPNLADKNTNFRCPTNKILVGQNSTADMYEVDEDDRFQFFCCGIEGIKLETCMWTKYLNNLHIDLSSSKYVMQGFSSDYESTKSDRQYRVYQCTYSNKYINVFCGKPGSTPKNSVKWNSDYFFDDVVKYSCLDGYVQVGGSSSRTCLANKTWSGSDIRCEIASCGDPGTGSNAVRYGSVYTFGASVRYKCRLGFHPIGGSDIITCAATKTWSREPLKCGFGKVATVAILPAAKIPLLSETGKIAAAAAGGFVAGVVLVLLVVLIVYRIKWKRQTRDGDGDVLLT